MYKSKSYINKYIEALNYFNELFLLLWCWMVKLFLWPLSWDKYSFVLKNPDQQRLNPQFHFYFFFQILENWVCKDYISISYSFGAYIGIDENTTTIA